MTKPFADFKEDLTLFCSENKIDNDKISIVGVSKKKSLEDILSLYELGLRDFGENYAQELNEKSLALDIEKIRWHFMGPIQTNKLGLIVKNSYLVHSVDREKVVKKMDLESKKTNKIQKVLVQVNISGEASKSGIFPGDAEEFIDFVESFDNLELAGLMFMPNINQDKVSPFLIKNSSPEEISIQIIKSVIKDPTPFNVVIRLALSLSILITAKNRTDNMMIKRITYALIKIKSIPIRKSERITKTKTIPSNERASAKYFTILNKFIPDYFLLFTKISIRSIDAFSISLTILSILAIM